MESKQYYGIGTDEYGIYKTMDNGKTWSYIREAQGDMVNTFGRIIIYSDKDKGLKYTDDGFATIQDSNVMNGNWVAVKDIDQNETSSSNRIYASSLDGRGIWFTTNRGETWHRLSSGTGNTLVMEGDKTIIYGNGDVVEIIDGTPLYHQDTEYTPGAGMSPNKELKIGSGLLYLLNDVIVPQLSNILTGYTNLNNFEYNNDPTAYGKYYTDGEVYKVKDEGIDFMGDVGMQPFTLSDIKEFNEVQNIGDDLIIAVGENDHEVKLSEELADTNSKLSKTFSILDEAINNYKEFIQTGELRKINDDDEDYEGLESKDDIETMKFFYDIQKGAIASITGTIINSIFTFNNSKKMALLKTSIMETANSMKNSLQSKLVGMEKLIKKGACSRKDFNNDFYKEQFTFDDLGERWEKALYKSLMDYYIQVSRNVNSISSNHDREYVVVAAGKYKEIRNSLIDVALSCLMKLHIIETSPENKIASDLLRAIDDFGNEIDTAVADYLSPENPDPSEEETVKKFQAALNKYIAIEAAAEKKDENFFFGNTEAKLKEEFKKLLDEEISVRNAKLNDKFYFDEIDYEEDLEDLSPDERDKVFDYYLQIIDEFKNRCNRLLDISMTKAFDIAKSSMKVSDDLKEYVRLLDGSYQHSYEAFKKEHSLDDIKDSILSARTLFINTAKDNWKGTRGII